MQMDPLVDALSTMKNAEISGKMDAEVYPASKLVGEVLGVIKEQNYIESFEYVETNGAGKYVVDLIGNINDCKAVTPGSKPGRTTSRSGRSDSCQPETSAC